jgi:hypothetical protein
LLAYERRYLAEITGARDLTWRSRRSSDDITKVVHDPRVSDSTSSNPVADATESVNEAANCFWEVGVDLDGTSVVRDRLLNLSSILDRVSEIRQRYILLYNHAIYVSNEYALNVRRQSTNESGIKLDSLFVHLNGLLKLSHILEERPKVRIQMRVFIVQRQTGSIELECKLLSRINDGKRVRLLCNQSRGVNRRKKNTEIITGRR